MKRLLKSFTGIALSALLVAAMTVMPAFAETRVLEDSFDSGDPVNTVGLMVGINGNAAAILADPDENNPGNMVLQLEKTGTADLHLYVNYEETTKHEGLTEVSFDMYCPDFSAERSFQGRLRDGAKDYLSNIAPMFSINTSGSVNGKATILPKTWHNFRYIFDYQGESVYFYKLLDHQLIEVTKLAASDFGMLNYIYLPNQLTYYDNVRIAKYDTAPSVSLSVGGAAAADTFTVGNLFTRATATLTNCPMATSVVFKNNGNVIATAPVGADGTASAGVIPGDITAHVMCGANEVTVSSTVSVEGVSGTQSKYFSMDFTNVVNHPSCYADGKTKWGDYNYYIKDNRAGFGTGNASKMQFNYARNTSANGVDLKEGVHGEAVLLTSKSGTEGNDLFSFWARSDDPGIYYGVSQAEYDAAPGASYSEKMAAQYIVVQASYRFLDFNAERHLIMPFFTNAGGTQLSWARQSCVKVEASAGADVSKMVMYGNGAEIAEVRTNTWYTVTNVIDLKNATSWVFMDGEMKAKCDFSSEEDMDTLINIYEILNYQEKPESGISETYIDDFCVYSLAFTNEIADPAADGSITIKNDGSAREMSIITAIYTDSDCKKLEKTVITPANLAAGELQKKVTPNAALTSGQTAKTIYVNNLTDIKPLRAAK